MIQIDISSFPKKLEQIDKLKFDLILKTIKITLLKQIKNPSYQNNFNLQKSLKRSLLLTHFLLEDKSSFEIVLKELRTEELKIREKESLYFDLVLLQSKPIITSKDEFLKNFEYDKLIGINMKWHLLFPNNLKRKYKAQLTHLAKFDWQASPEKYITLLELIIDWFYRLPSKTIFLKIVETKLSQVNKNLNRFWDLRTFDLTSIKRKLSPVNVAIWDTGVDSDSIKNISSNLSLGFDKNCNPTKEPLMPLDNINEKEWKLYRGFLDLKLAKKSSATKYFLQALAQYEEADVVRLRSIVNQLTVYCHGTSVASVASKRNPVIEIVPIRISFDPNQAFPTLYTVKRIENEVKMHQEVFNWLQHHKIPIVNVSWNIRAQDIETSLMNTGVIDKDERTILTKKLFGSLKKSLYEGIKSCSNTLFVIGAGNSNSAIEEEGTIPNNFNLPNLIAIGAVNHNGKRTGFTSIGKNVQLYANGSYVDTTIPNGYKTQASGTSLAAPQVCNLVATMLSLCPKTSVIELKECMLENADRMPEEDILVLNPKKTIEQILR